MNHRLFFLKKKSLFFLKHKGREKKITQKKVKKKNSFKKMARMSADNIVAKWSVFERIQSVKPTILFFITNEQGADRSILYYAERKGDVLEKPFVVFKDVYLSELQKVADVNILIRRFFAYTVTQKNGYYLKLNTFPDRMIRLRLKKNGKVTANTSLLVQYMIDATNSIQVEVEEVEIFNIHTVCNGDTFLGGTLKTIYIHGRTTWNQLEQGLQKISKQLHVPHQQNMNYFTWVTETIHITKEMEQQFEKIDNVESKSE